MPDTTTEPEPRSAHALGWCALILFVCGLLVPIILYAVLIAADVDSNKSVTVALVFAALSQLLALIIGIAARKSTPGKIALIGSSTLWLLAAVLVCQRFLSSSNAEPDPAPVPQQARPKAVQDP